MFSRNIGDPRHQCWMVIREGAIGWCFIAVALCVVAIIFFSRANYNGAPKILMSITMYCCFGALIALAISVVFAIWTEITRRRVEAQIRADD